MLKSQFMKNNQEDNKTPEDNSDLRRMAIDVLFTCLNATRTVVKNGKPFTEPDYIARNEAVRTFQKLLHPWYGK